MRSRAVAAHLISKRQELRDDPAKLNSLLYLCQAWSLACSGRPLFTDPILAGVNGPVITGVFQDECTSAG